MEKDQVRAELKREPFIPLRNRLTDGRKFDVPFRDVARFLTYGVLVFIGMKEGTRQAKSYDRFGFDQIERIEPLPAKKNPRGRRRAS
jgi:hypothetical protein